MAHTGGQLGQPQPNKLDLGRLFESPSYYVDGSSGAGPAVVTTDYEQPAILQHHTEEPEDARIEDARPDNIEVTDDFSRKIRSLLEPFEGRLMERMIDRLGQNDNRWNERFGAHGKRLAWRGRHGNIAEDYALTFSRRIGPGDHPARFTSFCVSQQETGASMSPRLTTTAGFAGDEINALTLEMRDYGRPLRFNDAFYAQLGTREPIVTPHYRRLAGAELGGAFRPTSLGRVSLTLDGRYANTWKATVEKSFSKLDDFAHTAEHQAHYAYNENASGRPRFEGVAFRHDDPHQPAEVRLAGTLSLEDFARYVVVALSSIPPAS